jgi:hypothetical protein
MAYASIGASPTNFVLDELGSEGYTMGADGVLYNFPITATLQNKNILNSTALPIFWLPPPVSGLPTTPAMPSTTSPVRQRPSTAQFR